MLAKALQRKNESGETYSKPSRITAAILSPFSAFKVVDMLIGGTEEVEDEDETLTFQDRFTSNSLWTPIRVTNIKITITPVVMRVR